MTWEVKNFEDCLEKVYYTNKIQRKDFLKSGKFPIVSQEQEYINGYWDNSKDLFKIIKPVVIFGDHTQVLKYVDFDFVLGADGVKILQPINNLNCKFFYYFLMSVNLKSLGYARHYRLLKEKLVPVPPLPEQHRIVAILDEAFKSITKAKENAEKNLKNAKEIFESYLQNVFKNKGEGWEEKTLDEITNLINRGIPPKYTESNGLCVLNQKCIRDHKINYDFARLHDLKIKKVNPERLIQVGDVLINSTGTGTLGRVAQIVEKKEATVDSHITIVRPKRNLFFNPFFGYALIYIENEIEKKGEGCGGQTELARNTIKQFKIIYPKSLKKQEEIVSKLNSITQKSKKLSQIYTQKLSSLEELKQSILKKAFKGKLTGVSV